MGQQGLKIKFQRNSSNFYTELKEQIKTVLTEENELKAKTTIKFKLLFYSVIYIGFYSLIFTSFANTHFLSLLLIYCFFGLSGILLAFNASHDAVHDTLFANQKLNAITHYLIFNLQGVNATLWKKRHLASHHLFPNVDGCDADIDDNPFLRLSESQSRRSYQKFQHIYAPIIYCIYTLHWIIIKDFIYLNKTSVANMTNLKYTKAFVLETIILKTAYFIIVLIIPTFFTSWSFGSILLAFVFMHFFISIFFVLTLIISHLTMETAFPIANEEGFLPFNYFEHQLEVSMDYHPTNKLANWVFGGFNSHAAHHLFPHLPHTLYTQVTPFIEKTAKKHKLTYNRLSILKAIQSHFLYLKKLGTS